MILDSRHFSWLNNILFNPFIIFLRTHQSLLNYPSYPRIPLWNSQLVYPSLSPCVQQFLCSLFALPGFIRGFLCQWIFCTHASRPHTNPRGAALFYACPLPVARPINGLSVGRSGPLLLHATHMGSAGQLNATDGSALSSVYCVWLTPHPPTPPPPTHTQLPIPIPHACSLP